MAMDLRVAVETVRVRCVRDDGSAGGRDICAADGERTGKADELTVATDVLEEFQVTAEVIFAVEPSL